MEDLCIVCAEPLQYAAYAECGHKDACSKCVLRLRSVLKDQRCVYCQVPGEAVFVTRFMGDYTETVAPDEFAALPGRAKRGELQYLESAQAYFDGAAHFRELSSLCSYTHPRVWQDNPDAPHKTFASLKALKAHLQQQHKLQFCDICLEGRKVFISEQQVYTKGELERHLRGGDVEGPMAVSGFKGHPECRFCRRRFYGENELFQHMHSAHEQCFLCRRANPNKYVYYRDYPDLENHFQTEHHLCPHPACLEKKFVVFPTEQELKTHTAREHGETLSKLEKKAALTLQMNFQYRRGEEEGRDGGRRGHGGAGPSGSSAGGGSSAPGVPHPLAAVLGGERRAVVIGGAASVPAQLRGRGGSRGNLQEALQASVESAQVESAVRASQQQQVQQQQQQQEEEGQGAVLNEADFPSVSGAAVGSDLSGGGRWAGAATGGVGGAGLNAEDFPALPGTSKSAKRRAAKKKSMASLLGGGGEVRVLNAAGGAGRPPLPPSADQFPALGHSSSTPHLAGGNAAAAPGPGRPAEASGGSSSAGSSRPGSAEGGLVQLQRDDWESVLPRAGRRGGAAGALPRPPSVQEIAPPSAQLREAEERLEARRQKHAEQREQRAAGISEALRAANKALVEKIRSQLDAQQFAEFRQQSGSWVRGDISSQQYHEAVAELGLVSLVPDLASTCPDAGKRAELLAVHKEAFASADGKGKGKGKWVPPEAAAVAARLAEQNSSWQCGACTLVNAPSARVCEACGSVRPSPSDASNQWKQQQQQQQVGGAGAALQAQPALRAAPAPVTAPAPASSGWAAAARPAPAPAPAPAAPAAAPAPAVLPPPTEDAFPALPAGAPASSRGGGSSSGGAGGGSKGKGPKKGKQSLTEFITATKVHPQNVWRNPSLKGQWAKGGGGTLAAEERALLDAYGAPQDKK
ncbi:hypothetical protein ABPG75_012071 [Micractinium tetrahymenae]